MSQTRPRQTLQFDLGGFALSGVWCLHADMQRLTISQFRTSAPAVVFQGVFGWFVWLFVHLMLLVGFRNKMVTFVNWAWSYLSYDRGLRLIIRPFKRK